MIPGFLRKMQVDRFALTIIKDRYMSTSSYFYSHERDSLMSWLSKPGKELPCTYRRCLVMIVSVAIVTGATAEPQLIAAESEPNILNLALPRALVPVDPKTRKGMEENVKRLFENLYCLAPDCKGNRPLQINIALGNDYQILDWLGKGWIDGAAIPALSLYLLRRDDVDLVEVDHTGWKRPVLKLLREGYVPPRGLEDFWQEIWEHARLRTRQNDEPSAFARAKDGCPLIASSHLSTPGFLAPVAATSQWLGKRLASDASTSNDSKATDRLANEFWHEFFDHVRFTFDVDHPHPQIQDLRVRRSFLGENSRPVRRGNYRAAQITI